MGLSTKLAFDLSVPHALFSDGQQQKRHLQQRTFRNCEHEQLFPITQKYRLKSQFISKFKTNVAPIDRNTCKYANFVFIFMALFHSQFQYIKFALDKWVGRSVGRSPTHQSLWIFIHDLYVYLICHSTHNFRSTYMFYS